MTLSDLNLHLDMVTQLLKARDRLESMTSFLRAQNIDGMPRGSGESRKVESLSILISEEKDEVDRLERMVARSEPEIKAYIDSIQDTHTRRVFYLRFISGYEWADVAAALGGKNTVDSVKSICYRYLDLDEDP